jgi:taurine dioxygenase
LIDRGYQFIEQIDLRDKNPKPNLLIDIKQPEEGAMHARVQGQADTVRVIPSGKALGADIEGVDLSEPLSPAVFEEIRSAWLDHLVLRFRGQHRLTPATLIGYSSGFGKLDLAPIASGPLAEAFPGQPRELTVISNVVVDGKPIGGLGAYEAVWHADMTYNDLPPKAACLFAVEVPPTGGNTQFANMYLAYETLPEALRRQVESLRCVHDASRNSAGELRNGFKDVSDPRETVGAVHPVVSVHPETGRKCLLLGRRRSAYLVGLPVDESEDLLNQLWAHACQPQFTWEQQWQVGDLIMWDNRCTMHRRDAFDPGTRRVMYRTQVSAQPVA